MKGFPFLCLSAPLPLSSSRKGLHFSEQTLTLYNINLNMEKNMENRKDIGPVFGFGVW